MKVFIIGPGGVGKTTAGKILAKKLEHRFIDLDDEFCERIENIGVFIKTKGYTRYCYRNSELFFELLDETKENFVIALSSGFLIHEGLDDLVDKHKQALQETGVSVLLLPSKSLEESEGVMIERQMKRGFGLEENRERAKIRSRFPKYKTLGDIKVFSHDTPEIIADLMFQGLRKHSNRDGSQ
ncbi:MAG: shikimate kinase [Patescibacteria group bacterium]